MTMYEFIILSQLMHGPAHGYLIAKIINDMIGPYARISYGRLYPLLAKLEQNGLITAEKAVPSGQPGDRQLRIYTLENIISSSHTKSLLSALSHLLSACA